MPYLIIKVLMIRVLMTLLVLNNWVLIFFLFFLENRIRHFEQIVSLGEICMKCQVLVFRKNMFFKMLSAEIFAKHAKC